MSKPRKYTCPKCGGVISIPRYSRMTLERAREIHEAACPQGGKRG